MRPPSQVRQLRCSRIRTDLLTSCFLESQRLQRPQHSFSRPAADTRDRVPAARYLPHTRFNASTKKPASPKPETVRNKSSGDSEGTALAAFQRDLLGQHHVSDRQISYGPETQAKPRAAAFVDLADVRHGARIDPVLPAGLATDDFEISSLSELRPLHRRQPPPQKLQGPAFRSALGTEPDEKGPHGSDTRAFAWPR